MTASLSFASKVRSPLRYPHLNQGQLSMPLSEAKETTMQINPYESPTQASNAARAPATPPGRLLIAARGFFALSFVPIIAMLYELWAFTVPSADQAATRMSYYMWATGCLGTIGAILFAIVRRRSPSVH